MVNIGIFLLFFIVFIIAMDMRRCGLKFRDIDESIEELSQRLLWSKTNNSRDITMLAQRIQKLEERLDKED
jgi:hypothetical protein